MGASPYGSAVVVGQFFSYLLSLQKEREGGRVV